MNFQSKTSQWVMLSVLVTIFVGLYWGLNSENNKREQDSIRIVGKKPADATVKAWANYWVSGEQCESYSYDMFGQKAHKGGKLTIFYTQNFAESDIRYELRVPYASYTDNQNCSVELRDITVEAYNEFDTAGFAQLRIYQAGERYNNKPIELSSKIEARECDSFIHQWKDNSWSGGLGCIFYFNEKRVSKLPEYNAKNVHFNFSQFNQDTVIHYDILAGDDYRTKPLDPKTGQ
ncbi:hypothetical protein [Vibrio paucivorans]|uniref:Uncharacterized protein n=1 Tax=Vibrio paucivorans TaxID=2829489 RepID=A0A9X3CIP9_9VIBR|nr:hypothetical protein [Vibrio paucivorans]MCW8336578.1 hypothetical protein [Vibrio paucivorans]